MSEQSESKSIAAEANDVASKVTAGVGQTIGAARDSMKNAYGVAKETAEDVRTAVVDKGTIAVRSAGRYVDDNPWIAVVAAALIGIAVCMLMRRR